MDFAELIPVVAIVSTAWVFVTYARLRHGRSTGEMDGSGPVIDDARDNARLAHENERLRLTIGRLEERLAVLERIATDPAERTAREIENLR
ncbi:MAG TPA: hypothetical protein VFO69_02780 [Allosphingosinicella sp.]|nr:hypothetical protein [Allosphingosinicella sp.]